MHMRYSLAISDWDTSCAFSAAVGGIRRECGAWGPILERYLRCLRQTVVMQNVLGRELGDPVVELEPDVRWLAQDLWPSVSWAERSHLLSDLVRGGRRLTSTIAPMIARHTFRVPPEWDTPGRARIDLLRELVEISDGRLRHIAAPVRRAFATVAPPQVATVPSTDDLNRTVATRLLLDMNSVPLSGLLAYAEAAVFMYADGPSR